MRHWSDARFALAELMGRGGGFHSGACARDMQQPYRRDCVVAVPEICAEPRFVLERYVIGVDGEMRVFGPRGEIPLSLSVKRGYDFQI